MRVWLVNHHAVPPSEPGGIRHYALARQLIRNGNEVTVIASSFNHATGKEISCAHGKLRTFEQFGEVPFLLLCVPAYHSHLSRLWNMFVFAFELWLGLGVRTMDKPDIVIGSSLTLFAAFAAERLARRMRVPFVLEIRDLWPQTLIDMGMRPHHPAVVGFGMIERYLYRNSDKIVTLLPNASEYIALRGGRSKDITWIPNGVDLEMMTFPCAPSPRDVFTVLYAGSHGLSDALDSVLDAAAILNERAPGLFCFRMVGDGPDKPRLCRRVEMENIANVRFDPPVPKREVFSLLQEADAFIITAKKTDLYRYGISPNKLHEYMAAGRPTIFAGSSHNDPVAEATAGITVAPEDSAAIAAAAESLAAMSIDERWNMGVRARRYVEERHDFSGLSRRLEEVLQSALASPQRVRKQLHGVDVESAANANLEMLSPGRLRKIIVNADDFGLSAEVNRAVVEAFQKGVISSATLMANMPGFDEACELTHRHGLLGKIGVHLNLSSGYPLSAPVRRCSRFCDDTGMFRSRRTRFRLSKKERHALETEFAAQVKACLDRGLRPTHLDSHHHVHTEWAIGAAAIAVARRYGIRAIRLSRNCGPGIDWVRKVYKVAYNSRLRIYGLAKTRYFGSSTDVQEILAATGDVEVMVHMNPERAGNIPDGSSDPGIERLFAAHHLASYS